MGKRLCLFLAAAFLTACCQATEYLVESPDNRVRAKIALTPEGVITYRMDYMESPVVLQSMFWVYHSRCNASDIGFQVAFNRATVASCHMAESIDPDAGHTERDHCGPREIESRSRRSVEHWLSHDWKVMDYAPGPAMHVRPVGTRPGHFALA